MSIINVHDVMETKDGGVIHHASFVIESSGGLNEVSILPGLTLTLDSPNDSLDGATVCGWVVVQLSKDSVSTKMARVYFMLTSHFYTCSETRSLLNGPFLGKLIANYIQKTYGVQVGLTYLTEDWKVGGHISARGDSNGRGEYLYYISNRCK
jgi:hypothetical protein